MAGMSRPIIATAQFDENAQTTFQEARDRWFPPRLNVVPAHLTLFHHLPGDNPEEAANAIEEASGRFGVIEGEASELISLSGGFAYRIECPELKKLREAIADRFEGRLTKQDQQGFRPHVTVQNKVTKDTARLCLEEAQKGFEPVGLRILGVQLWFYDGGPWEDYRSLPLRDA
jgi:2'-5' RNA ligase